MSNEFILLHNDGDIDAPELSTEMNLQKAWATLNSMFDQEDFCHLEWNTLLFMLVMYANKHEFDFQDKCLPWATLEKMNG